MTTRIILDILALSVIFVMCAMAVWGSVFKDTVMQCLALGCVAISSVAMGFWLVDVQTYSTVVSGFIWSVALFAAETGRKLTKQAKTEARVHVVLQHE